MLEKTKELLEFDLLGRLDFSLKILSILTSIFMLEENICEVK